MTCGVYRAFDAAGRLLYVGSSVDVEKRLATHHSQQPAWYVYQDRIDIEPCDSEAVARETEARAIATEHPRWNVTGRSADHPDGFALCVGGMHWLAAERALANRVSRLRQERAAVRRKFRDVSVRLKCEEAAIAGISNGWLDMSDVDDIA